MNPKDRRVRKTKTQLENGLAGLLREKAINEITVTELTERLISTAQLSIFTTAIFMI